MEKAGRKCGKRCAPLPSDSDYESDRSEETDPPALPRVTAAKCADMSKIFGEMGAMYGKCSCGLDDAKHLKRYVVDANCTERPEGLKSGALL